MQLIERILTCYGWEGAALAGALLLLGVPPEEVRKSSEKAVITYGKTK